MGETMRTQTDAWKVPPVAALRAAAAAAVALATLVWAAPAPATVIVTDGFGDADRDNDGVTDGAAATDPADVGLKWTIIGGFTSGDVPEPKPEPTIVADDTVLGGGNSMHLEGHGANSEIIATLPAPVQIGPNVGDSVKLSFRFRIDPAATPAFTTPGDGPSDQRFVFGLYRDADGELGTGGFGTADGNFDNETAPGAGDDPGISARIPVWVDDGQAQGARINFESANQGDSILTGSTTYIAGTNQLDTTFTGIAQNDLAAHDFSLTLTRNDLEGNIHGRLDLDGQFFADVRETAPLVTLDTFDYLVFTAGQNDFDYFIDDVTVESSTVPEPGSLGAAAVGLAALAARGRRGRGRRN